MPLLSRIGAFFHTIAEGARKLGYKAKEFFEAVSRHFPEYRLEEAEISYESWSEQEKLRWRWYELEDDEVIPEDYYYPNLYEQPTKYRVTMRAYLRHRETGEIKETFITKDFDFALTKRELYEWLVKKFSISDPTKNYDVLDWAIESAWVKT